MLTAALAPPPRRRAPGMSRSVERSPASAAPARCARGDGAAAARPPARRPAARPGTTRFTRLRPGERARAAQRRPAPGVPRERGAWRALAEAVATPASRPAGSSTARSCRDRGRRLPRRDPRAPLPLALALRLAPPPPARPALPAAGAGARSRSTATALVHRPPGVALDSGGLAKGLFADLIAERARRPPSSPSTAPATCASAAGAARAPVHVASPFGGRTVHTFELDRRAAWPRAGSAAAAGSTPAAAPAHHLLDPATGARRSPASSRPPRSRPTALEAEVRAKAAVLSGPERRARAGCRTAACSSSTTAATRSTSDGLRLLAGGGLIGGRLRRARGTTPRPRSRSSG